MRRPRTSARRSTNEVILGASNEGGTTRDLPAMMNNLAGAKFRIVTGYAGSKEIGLAVERNEVHGACGIGWTGFTTLYPHWFEKKLVTMTLQLAVKGHAELTTMGVPLATEFARSQEDRQAMELVLSQGVFGRPFVLPPGVPPERARRAAQGVHGRDDRSGAPRRMRRRRTSISRRFPAPTCRAWSRRSMPCRRASSRRRSSR